MNDAIRIPTPFPAPAVLLGDRELAWAAECTPADAPVPEDHVLRLQLVLASLKVRHADVSTEGEHRLVKARWWPGRIRVWSSRRIADHEDTLVVWSRFDGDRGTCGLVAGRRHYWSEGDLRELLVLLRGQVVDLVEEDWVLRPVERRFRLGIASPRRGDDAPVIRADLAGEAPPSPTAIGRRLRAITDREVPTETVLLEVLGHLADPDARIRREAAMALALSPWTWGFPDCLDHPDPRSEHRVLLAAPPAGLERAVQDGDPAVASAALCVLQRFVGAADPCRRLLLTAMGHRDGGQRRLAAAVLRAKRADLAIRDWSPEDALAWHRALSVPEVEVRLAAIESATATGERHRLPVADQECGERLARPDVDEDEGLLPRVRRRAAHLLAGAREVIPGADGLPVSACPLLDTLRTGLGDADPRLREASLVGLHNLARVDHLTQERLRGLEGDSDPGVRINLVLDRHLRPDVLGRDVTFDDVGLSLLGLAGVGGEMAWTEDGERTAGLRSRARRVITGALGDWDDRAVTVLLADQLEGWDTTLLDEPAVAEGIVARRLHLLLPVLLHLRGDALAARDRVRILGQLLERTPLAPLAVALGVAAGRERSAELPVPHELQRLVKADVTGDRALGVAAAAVYGRQAIGILRLALGDHAAEVRRAALLGCRHLQRWHAHAPVIDRLLVEVVVQDRDPFHRWLALRALAGTRQNWSQDVDATDIEALLGDGDRLLRWGAVRVWARRAPSSVTFRRGLASLLRDPEHLVRMEALRALGGRLIGGGILEGIHAALQDSNPAVRLAALVGCRRAVDHGRDLLDPLADRLADPVEKVLQQCLRTIGSLGASARSLADEVACLMERDRRVAMRQNAARCLARIGAGIPRVTRVLTAHLVESHPCRNGVAWKPAVHAVPVLDALRILGGVDTDLLDQVHHLTGEGPSTRVVHAILRCLDEAGRSEPTVFAVLVRLLEADADDVRAAVLDRIRRRHAGQIGLLGPLLEQYDRFEGFSLFRRTERQADTCRAMILVAPRHPEVVARLARLLATATEPVLREVAMAGLFCHHAGPPVSSSDAETPCSPSATA